MSFKSRYIPVDINKKIQRTFKSSSIKKTKFLTDKKVCYFKVLNNNTSITIVPKIRYDSINNIVDIVYEGTTSLRIKVLLEQKEYHIEVIQLDYGIRIPRVVEKYVLPIALTEESYFQYSTTVQDLDKVSLESSMLLDDVCKNVVQLYNFHYQGGFDVFK